MPAGDAPGEGRPPALRLRGVSKAYAGRYALQPFDLDIEAGEIHALMGQNGSGKSTLVKLLAGYHSGETGGRSQAAGTDFELGDAAAARAAGLRFVHQDLGLIDSLSVAANFWLDRPGRLLTPMRFRRQRHSAAEALGRLGYQLDPDAAVSTLAASERTAVAVARALDEPSGVRLLVLDEPTASLPQPEVERLFAAVRRIAAAGTAVLFVSHHLDEVLDLADRLTVLRDGSKVGTTEVARSSKDDIVAMMLGRRLLAELTSHEADGEDSGGDGNPRLKVTDLTGAVVDGISLTVPAGRIVGIAGLTGSGRDELAGLLAGSRPRGGTVCVDGRRLRPGDPRAAVRAGVCCAPSDRVSSALVTGASVRENLTIAGLGSVTRRSVIRVKAERDDTRVWLSNLEVRPPEPEKVISELSGGNQQKVVLARWLRVRPAVLVLDEPTQGVDVGAKADIHDFIRRIAAEGVAVIVSSSDTEELAALADEVLVLRVGRIASRLTGARLTQERIDHDQLNATGEEVSGRVAS